MSTLIESAVSSNRIEVVPVDPARVRDVLVSPKPLFRDRDEEEVRGCRDALAWIHNEAVGIPVDEQTINRLHALTRGKTWDAGQLVDSTKKDIEQRRGEIGDIIVAALEAAASVGVAHFTADFNAEADAQDLRAKKWLKTTGGLAAVTIVAALLMIFVPLKPDAITPQVIQLFTSKVVIACHERTKRDGIRARPSAQPRPRDQAGFQPRPHALLR